MYDNCGRVLKAPSQLALILYLDSNVAGEAGNAASLLSIALQFPQYCHWFSKRFIWKCFHSLSERKEEREKKISAALESHREVCGTHHFEMWQFPWYSIKPCLQSLTQCLKETGIKLWVGWLYKKLRPQCTAQGRWFAKKLGCVHRDTVHIRPEEKKGHSIICHKTHW